MRKLNKAIDRFCALHPRFGIPGLMRYIVGANLIIYFLSMFAKAGTLSFLALDTSAVFSGELWRIVTYALIPSYDGIWLFISLIFYYWLGEALERLWGSAKFTIYYISGVLLTAIAVLLAALISGVPYYVAGADYVNSALFFAYAMTYPETMVRIMFVIPIKMKWVAWAEGALYGLSVILALTEGAWGAALIPVVALLNFFVFFSPEFYRKADVVRARTRPQAVLSAPKTRDTVTPGQTTLTLQDVTAVPRTSQPQPGWKAAPTYRPAPRGSAPAGSSVSRAKA